MRASSRPVSPPSSSTLPSAWSDGIARHQLDRAAGRVLAVQRALRAAQDLDALDVEQREQRALDARVVARRRRTCRTPGSKVCSASGWPMPRMNTFALNEEPRPCTMLRFGTAPWSPSTVRACMSRSSSTLNALTATGHLLQAARRVASR
jgi:hypothetical protein